MREEGEYPALRQAEIDQRDPVMAIAELHACLCAMNATIQVLASMYPGVTAMAGIVRGEPCGVLAFARSREADHFIRAAMNAAHGLARIVPGLVPELAAVFEIDLRSARERQRIEQEIEMAVANALAQVMHDSDNHPDAP